MAAGKLVNVARTAAIAAMHDRDRDDSEVLHAGDSVSIDTVDSLWPAWGPQQNPAPIKHRGPGRPTGPP